MQHSASPMLPASDHSGSDIDFLLLWVDGEDKHWQRSMADHAARVDASRLYLDPAHYEEVYGQRRFRDMGTLRYVLRSMERHAPWYRHLYFVTNGQFPGWMNRDHPKLRWVRHEEFFRNPGHLPTFSSNAIQMNMHRIEGLAEQFVVFDDDIVLTHDVQPTDFFRRGLPLKSGYMGCFMDHTPYQTSCRRNLARARHIIGHIFGREYWRAMLSGGDARIWAFNALVAAYALASGRTLFPGGYNHMPVPVLKSQNAACESLFGDLLERTSSHKFRELDDATLWLLNMVYYANGRFLPGRYKSRFIFVEDHMQTLEHFKAYDRTKFEPWLVYKVVRAIIKPRYRSVCLQDHTTDHMHDDAAKAVAQAVADFLQEKLPEPCAYELAA